MRAPRAVLGPVKRGVTDTPRREGSGEARVSHHPLACPRYFTHYTDDGNSARAEGTFSATRLLAGFYCTIGLATTL